MVRQFIIDTMLGKLAKWLRVMSYDAHYQSYYKNGELAQFIKDGRVLLSRDRKIIQKYKDSFFIKSDHVSNQLLEIKESGYIKERDIICFLRCLICNTPLEKIQLEKARGRIPEYIYNQSDKHIIFCRSCGRYFWPGSHKNRMIKQLKEWGFELDGPQKKDTLKK